MNGTRIIDKMQIDHGQPLLIPTTICVPNNDKIYRNSKESNKCGFMICKCDLFQKLASKKLFVLIQGLISCCFISSFAYYNATITTLEKRYEIPSRNVGLITTGFDLSTLVMTPILSFYLGKMHRPRWVGLSGFVMGIYCLVVAFLHVITGPGEYALSFTEKDYNNNVNYTSNRDTSNSICSADRYDLDECSEKSNGHLFPQLYLFVAQFITGFIGSIHESLGTAYMDDNILKSKVPLYLSILQCIRLFGPAFGYLLASICLKFYIVPTLSPTIEPNDPKWMGAWWLGYVIIGTGLIIFSFLISCFPNELPHSAFRKQISDVKKQKVSNEGATLLTNSSNEHNLTKILKGLKSIISNKIFMFTILSNIFNLFGNVPYTMYGAKYVETQFRQTASYSSLLTGPTTIACTTIGIFASGWFIHKFQPQSRNIVLWILCTACFSLVSVSSFIFIGCVESEAATHATNQSLYKFNHAISECNCDLVKYTPICGDDQITYLSPCHAGCLDENILDDHTSIYNNCTFVQTNRKTAVSGSCPVDCSNSLFIFIVILCFERLLTSSGRSSCFFLTIKSIHKQDKEFALAIGMAFKSMLVFVPAPILFGWIFDKTCLFWGKTCNGDGNCWLYDNERTRVLLNIISIVSIVIGIGMDCCTIWNIKGLLLFDMNEDTLVNELKVIKKSLNGSVNREYDSK